MPYKMVKGPHGSRVRQWYSERKLTKTAKKRWVRDKIIEHELNNEK